MFFYLQCGKCSRKQKQVKRQKEALILIACMSGCGMFILEDGEILGDQSECHDACGEDADGDGDFGQGGEVIYVVHEGG